MRILFASSHPFPPQLHGGAQSSTHELATAFADRGHTTAILSGLTKDGMVGLLARGRIALGRKYSKSARGRYRIYRTWFPHLVIDQVSRDFEPDVIVLTSGKPYQLAQALRAAGVTTRIVIYIRNVERDDFGGDALDLTNTTFVANSTFTADWFHQQFGLRIPFVYPLIDARRYAVRPRREHVTFINPHPMKGVDIAIEIAKHCSAIPFLFVPSWTISKSAKATLDAAIRPQRNIELRASTSNMRGVYQTTGLLLVPSRCDEAFGRVVAEAQLSGIPVVGSNRGGLPEAIGNGGITLSVDDPIDKWVQAVSRVWTNDSTFDALSQAATHHSRRRELDTETQLGALLELFRG